MAERIRSSEVDSVRSFIRVLTEFIGPLHDEHLYRGRPQRQSRILREIDQAGTDVRILRTTMGLDSGYLSRMLRALEAEGLVIVERDVSDRRVRKVRPTVAGERERNELDRLSTEFAETLLTPLCRSQRSDLTSAMEAVEALLPVAELAGDQSLSHQPPISEVCD